MLSRHLLILLLAATGILSIMIQAFVPSVQPRRQTSRLHLLVAPQQLPPVEVNVDATTVTTTTTISQQSVLRQGMDNYLAASSSSSSSQLLLSLQDRPSPPTAEEIAAKKRTFDLWFWGGGFVAPFAATIFYFGFKFWEK